MFRSHRIRQPFPLFHLIISCWLLAVALSTVWPAPSLAQTGAEGQAYVVQGDDTLWKIAEKQLGNGRYFREIISATNAKHAEDATFASIEDPNIIVFGSKLWLPALESLPAIPAEAPFQAQPVTTAPSSVGSPAGKIAFSFWNNAPERYTYEINIIEVQACLTGREACQANRRIFVLGNASEPALSPDGQRLVFRGWGAIPEKYEDDKLDHPYFKDDPGPQAERMLGNATLDGTNYLRISHYFEDSHPDWSPNGQRLIYDTGRMGDDITRIMAMSTDGTYEEDLRIAGQQPSWAPDNDRFVYRGCDITGNRCGLWLARAIPLQAWDLGKNMIGPLLQEPEAAHPDWSPVGNQIVYQSPKSGSWDLYLINADGSNQRQLTHDPAIEGLPAWSPDGQWVAYLSNAGGNWGIWLIRADGSQRQHLFAFDGGTFNPKPITPYFSRDWLDEQISWSR
jgi:hypothetical protein